MQDSTHHHDGPEHYRPQPVMLWIFGLIAFFCGEPLHTSPENALWCEP
jgi:hypothetical protein